MAVALTPAPSASVGDDTPRTIVSRGSRGDVIFRSILRAAGLSSFGITALILIFLIYRGWWALKTDGLGFFTKQNWVFVGNEFGIGGILPDTVIIAVIAAVIGIPIAVGTAIFISEYAPGGYSGS